jgi:hypothetical protein
VAAPCFRRQTLGSRAFGLDISPVEYDQHFIEFQVPYSTAMYSVLDGDTYLTGPMATYSLNYDRLPAEIMQAASRTGLGASCTNPFRSIVVRAVDLVHARGEALRLIRGYQPPEPPSVQVRPASRSATAAPRRRVACSTIGKP